MQNRFNAVRQFSTLGLLLATTACEGDVTAPGATTPLVTRPGFELSLTGVARTDSVPESITGDCSVDVTAALQEWIASMPDHSTLVFGESACYNIDSGLKINDRNGLTLEGNGSTFRRISRGVTQQSNFSFQGGSSLTIRNMIIRGANPNAGLSTAAYVAEIENQHGIHLAGMQGALIEDIQVYDVYGDFVAMTHDYRLPAIQFPGLPNRDVVIRRGHFDRNGRMGVAVTHGERIALEDSYIGNVRWSSFDLELDDDRAIGRSIRIERNRFGPMMHSIFVNKGKGLSGNVGNVTIRGNVMEAQSATCLAPIAMRSRYSNHPWSGWVIENNTLQPRYQGLAIDLTRATDVVASNNTIVSGKVGGCGLKAPIQVAVSRRGNVNNNRVLGSWPAAYAVDAATTGFNFTNNYRQ